MTHSYKMPLKRGPMESMGFNSVHLALLTHEQTRPHFSFVLRIWLLT